MYSRLTDRDDWFELWYQDKMSILETMKSNRQADIYAGHDPNGISIKRQDVEIHDYWQSIERQLLEFVRWENKQVNRWCFYDMKKRGAIL